LDFGIWNLANEIAMSPAAPRNDKQKWPVSASHKFLMYPYRVGMIFPRRYLGNRIALIVNVEAISPKQLGYS
jgi:hypothetical protein